ncbi:unnamed protein product, partial [Prorocentrum cordatum]
MRDHGTFCLFLPLKLGVGIACMLVFVSSMVSILALLSSDIRFRATGYNQTVYYFPEIVGAFGIVFGFVGLLGTYDDKWYQLWWFNRYFAVKLAAICVAVFADFVTLQGCEDYVRRNPPYVIDFGGAEYDAQSRWDFYKVRDPRRDRPLEPPAGLEEEDPFVQYGAVRQ